MPSDKFKFSAKNGVAPVIKKLYNSRKKLLGKTSTPNKTEYKNKEGGNVKREYVPSKVTTTPVGEGHPYENLNFTNSEKSSFSEEVFAGVNLSLSSLNLDGESSFYDALNSDCQGLSSDCSTLTNYDDTETTISTPTSDMSASLVGSHQDFKITQLENVTVVKIDDVKEKLKTAIDHFDKILSEYTPAVKQPPPKLQKSKTCSIIESKCILKKDLFGSGDDAETTFKSLNLTQITTRSLCHLDRNLEMKSLLETQKFLSEMDFWKTTSKDNDPVVNKTEEAKPIKVKEVIKRLNSLSSDDEKKSATYKKTHNKSSTKPLSRKKSDGKDRSGQRTPSRSNNPKPPLQKMLSNERRPILKTTKTKTKDTKKEACPKMIPKCSNDNVAKIGEIKSSLIPRAVSCYDVSGINKKPTASKIPVKTNLNRTFPSTPSNLNSFLDLTMRCTAINYDEKCQSVQNLAAKIGQVDRQMGIGLKNAFNVDLERTVSCQNLSKVSAKTEDIKTVIKKNLARNNSGEPAKNLGLTKGGDENVSKNIKGKMEDFENKSGLKLKKEGILETKKKLARNLTYNKNSGPNPFDNCPKSVVVTEEEKEYVKQFLEDFKKEELARDQKKPLKVKDAKTKPEIKTEWRKSENFGVKKSSIEPPESTPERSKRKPNSIGRKNGLKRTDTYNKNERVRESIEKIERNLKTAEEFVVNTNFTRCEILKNSLPRSEANCILKIEDVFALSEVVPSADVREAEKIVQSDKNGDQVDIKDYLSDDNSDDSGNISNELELEFEDVPAVTRSRTGFSSSESFLSKDSGKIGENFTAKTDDKIFFRSGVLTMLESQRDEKLAGMVVSLQAHCRGYLARKKLSQRKLQDLAVRCIQRNVRKFLLVRDWPWWRLLVRVTPLLNVHRTEEELKMKTEELEVLKAKLEKLESERVSLKHHNDKLEAKLSEMTADLAEEHSTSTLAAERLDAETADRLRLERELGDVQQKNKDLQNASERLEMELLYARSELNGISEDDEDPDGEAVYKQRYERAMRELEFTKRRLQQQHEDDLEQLVGLKKQLEKKLTDAYEEVEEQRQVVGQWKRKVQKLNGEMNDLKLLLEEQNARNNLLEKKQRKFDSELQLLQDELKKEKQTKERFSREKEVMTAEKFTLESNVADLRLELDLKEEKLTLLQKELDELTYGGKTEEEVTLLRKQKIDCERRLHDQEEELDELAGQVQLLEQAKLKLEMNLEQQRKTAKKETQQHDEELEEVRCNAQKKVKALEAQLENEHEERTILLREKHELERRLTAALENDRSEKACDEAVLQRLKRDLKRTKALLRDTQAQLERQKAENPSKALIRQLKNQIEDLECARSAAVKTKQILEAELSETQAQLDETARQKNDLEEKSNIINREKADLQLQVEENEEELAEVLKKYKTTIQQMSLDQLALQEQVSLVGDLEAERNSLKEQLTELTSKLDSLENAGDASSNILVKRTELKVKELESKLDLEQTTRTRLEVQISRLKEAMEKLQHDLVTARTKEQNAQDQIRKLQRSLRELRDEHNNALTKESESLLKRKELEKRYEALESESSTVRADLRLALKRIEDLQAVIQNDLEDSTENSDSEHDSYSSDDSVNTFLANHKISNKSSSMQFDNQRRLSNTSRSSTSSNLTKDSSYA